MGEVGYTLEALHADSLDAIVWFRLTEAQGDAIIRALWPDENFWSAPGGSSVVVSTEAEARVIGGVLGDCGLGFDPSRHRWLFHVHPV